MRRKFFTDSSIMDSLDELSKKKLSKNLKNLLYVSDSDWKRFLIVSISEACLL